MAEAIDLMIPGRAGDLAVRTKGLESHPRNIVVLVQGANLSGQAGYDLRVPGGRDYSLMDLFVERGFGAITFAIRGYGRSGAPADPLTIDTDAAIEDLESVFDWATAEALPLLHLAGWSWGGRIVARFAARHPDRVARLALIDPALGGHAPIPFEPREPWFSGGWQYFHDRLQPEYTEPGAAAALADFVVRHEPRSPNGIRAENARGPLAARAAEITRPTLMIYGSAAAQQNYMQGGIARLTFFEELATRDKSFVIVPDCGDYAHFQKPRRRYGLAIADFLLAS
jgi:pimeloyl-ACP methyl ester carboxylesterase